MKEGVFGQERGAQRGGECTLEEESLLTYENSGRRERDTREKENDGLKERFHKNKRGRERG